MQQELERCLIFVDHSNLYQNLKKVDGRIDYVRFREILSESYHLVGSMIYIGRPVKVSMEQQKFYDYLKSSKYVIHFRPLQEKRDGGYIQKGIDILIYKHIVELAEADSSKKQSLIPLIIGV